MLGFRSLNNSTSKRVLDLLEPVKLMVWKVNVIVAGFRKCRDLVREGKVFIRDKAKVASRVGCSERRVVNFRKLLFTSDKKKLSFRRVESKKVCSHPGRDLL